MKDISIICCISRQSWWTTFSKSWICWFCYQGKTYDGNFSNN
jgi:hypothetical protein